MFNSHRSADRPPAKRRVRFAVTAAAVAAATAVATLPAVIGATPALAENGPGTPPYWAMSPFSVPGGTGASLPFTEQEAESASTNGSIIGPDFKQGDLATEASGREAVQLSAQGQYVQFTTTSTTNAINVHYAVPQGSSGTLDVYVNGTKLSQSLSMTSAYSYITTSGITGTMTHKMYDDVRMMLGQSYPSGTTIKLQVDSGNSATPYTIDVVDFYNVPAAISQPSGTVSVASYGADPTGAADSSNAFNSAISAANSAGQAVWVPSGTYLVNSHLNITNGTIEGAGNWYTQIKANELIDNTSAVSGAVNLSNFAILGSTVGRHDDSTANAIDGSLGNGWTVNGLWIQDTNVGFWLQYGNSNCTVENSVVESTDADGLNFNGNASSCTVKNNFLRNTGDDGLAIWSYPTADSNITFSNNTIVQPTVANGIADYGGSNNTISNNVVADTEPLGSGISISNEAFLQPFTPLSGTITVSGNYLIRTGAYNPNWSHPMGAVQFDAYDTSYTNVTVNYSGGAILDSPYEAFEMVGGAGTGQTVTGLNISNVQVQNTGTTVMQAETGGSASISGVTASGIGVSGAYNDGYNSGNYTPGAFTFNLGTGNSGWSTTPDLTTFPDPVQAGALKASTTSLSFGNVNVGSSSSSQPVTITNPGTSAASVSSITASSGFSQTNNCGGSIAAGGSCTINATFSPTASGNATGSLTVNSSAPGSPLTISLAGRGVSSTTDLAQGQPTTASGSQSGFPTSNAVDGNTSTYWESTNNAFPQWFQVDLGAATSIGSIEMNLPPSTAWGARTQTILIQGSTDGTNYSTLVGTANYTFDPNNGNNTANVSFTPSTVRYVKLTFTANTGWPAGQLSELQIFSGGGSTGGSALSASPTSESFGSVAVGSTSSAQTVTVSNPGSTAASSLSVSVSGPFAQTNTCGSSLAAGANCTVSVTFKPTAAGAASGTLSVASSAPNSPLTVSLSGTGTSTNPNLALNQPVTASGYTQTYVPSNAVDGNTSSYWESTDNAFPQWFQVDLGSSHSISRIVMDLPPSTSWGTRTQTILIQGSTDGTNYTTLAASTGYTFNPSTGNTATATFTSSSVRYVKLTFTANTAWPAGQLSELQVFAQ